MTEQKKGEAEALKDQVRGWNRTLTECEEGLDETGGSVQGANAYCAESGFT